MAEGSKALPDIVSEDEWLQALHDLRAKEKAHTRAGDALSAERRRLPMVKVDARYRFFGAPPNGLANEVSLLDLFEDRQQLIVYHFMFGADWEEGCSGCSWVVDAMSHSAHLNARDTSLVAVSLASIDKLQAYRNRMGWDLPWYSSSDSSFNLDMGATVDGGEHHGLSVYFRHGDEVYRTYNTTDRGIEHLGSHWSYLDLTPFGRQEPWEVTPEGRPQSAAHEWVNRHDEY